MTHTVLLNCSIKAEIRAVDSQSDLTIFVIVMIIRKINCVIHWKEIDPVDTAIRLFNNWGLKNIEYGLCFYVALQHVL